MDLARKRRRRFTAALAVATALAAALVYTSVSASSQTIAPGRLLATAKTGQRYQLTGRVLPGYVRRGADELDFRVADRSGGASVAVRYKGAVPDPFRAGREVIVTVRRSGGAFVGDRDSLVTKCPSKFQDKPG